VEDSGQWPRLKYYPSIYLEELRETTKMSARIERDSMCVCLFARVCACVCVCACVRTSRPPVGKIAELFSLGSARWVNLLWIQNDSEAMRYCARAVSARHERHV
jgi:hypothetical protein